MNRGTRGFLLLGAAVLALLTAGCGEPTNVTLYEAGKYKGKTDDKPWANEHFADKTAWDKQLQARVLKQNDYVRIGG